MEGHTEGPAAAGGSSGHGAVRDALDRVESELARVEQALTRLDDGTYGTCERCQARLDDELLGSDPLAFRCADHR